MQNKTLIGKENYLFLINDSCNELGVHCSNILMIQDINLTRFKFDKYILTVFPNKSLYYKEYLPDEYNIKYRPALDVYKNKLGNNLFDSYKILKDINDAYYKTDTHINLKGNYYVYLEFIKKCNFDYNMNLLLKDITLNKISVELSSLCVGIGDLTWGNNLGNQTLDDKQDTYYYSDDFEQFYMKHIIKNNGQYIFYNYKIEDKTHELENALVDWNVMSSYIIYKNNNYETKNKVVIFYDSFLLSILPLYMSLFNEVYMIKNIYDNNLINLINPDYVFEFRVERFLF